MQAKSLEERSFMERVTTGIFQKTYVMQHIDRGTWKVTPFDVLHHLFTVDQGFPTHGPLAACGPRDDFLRPTKSNVNVTTYLLN